MNTRMKRLAVYIVVSLCASTISFAQSTQDDISIIQGIYGKEKRDVVQQVMNLNEGDAAKFWPVYDAYETERKKLGAERIAIIEDYANNYDQLTDEKADELVQRVFKNEAALTKLQKTYYEKVKKVLTPRTAARFMQVESYLLTAVRATVADQIPFVDELK